MKIRSSTAALAFVFLWISVSLLKHGETQASVLPSFRDVAQNTPEGEAVGWLAELDIISGFPDGSFRGTEPVDRSQAAKILLRASKKPMTVYFNRGRFADVDDGTWYVPYALTMSELGIVEGYADRTFKPKGTIKTAEFIKMAALTFELPTDLPYNFTDVDPSEWFAPFAGAAKQWNMFPNRGAFLEPARELTRSEVAVAVFAILSKAQGRPTLNGGEWPIEDRMTVAEQRPPKTYDIYDRENGGVAFDPATELNLEEFLHGAADEEFLPPAEGDGVTPGSIRTTPTAASRLCTNEVQCFAPFGCQYINQSFDSKRCLTGCGVLDCSADPTRPKPVAPKPVQYEQDPSRGCTSISCTDVPAGCHYEEMEFDAKGCQTKCGELKCKEKFHITVVTSTQPTYNNKGVLSYVIQLENTGVEPLFQIDMHQKKPENFAFHFPGSSPICSYFSEDDLIRCSGLSLFPGQTDRVVISYTPSIQRCEGSLESFVQVYAKGMQSVASKSVQTLLKCEGVSSAHSSAYSSAQSSEGSESAPDLSVSVEGWPESELVPDELVSFVVHARNDGETAENVVMELNVWEQNISRIFEFVSEESDQRCTFEPPAVTKTTYTKVGQDSVRCTAPSLATNGQEYFTIVFRVKNAQCQANLENFVQAGMTSSKTDKDVGDNYDFISFSDFPGCSRQPGSLYVKSLGADTAELALGARGHPILSMDLGNDFDSIGVGGFIFLTVDNEALTVKELHVMYGNSVIAVARPDTCGGMGVKFLNGKPTRAFCGVTGEDLFTVPRGMSRKLEVRPVMNDVSNGIFGGTVQLMLPPEVLFDGQTNPYPGIFAVRKVNNALLLKNNVDGEANGELIFGVNATQADVPILGSKNPVQAGGPNPAFTSSILNWIGSMFR